MVLVIILKKSVSPKPQRPCLCLFSKEILSCFKARGSHILSDCGTRTGSGVGFPRNRGVYRVWNSDLDVNVSLAMRSLSTRKCGICLAYTSGMLKHQK